MPCLLTGDLSEDTAIAAARNAGIALLGLSGLYVERPPQPGFLMGFAAYTPDELERAVDALERCLLPAAAPEFS